MELWLNIKRFCHEWAYRLPIINIFYNAWDSAYLDKHSKAIDARNARWDVMNAPRMHLFGPAPEGTEYPFLKSWNCHDCGMISGVYLNKYASAIESIQDEMTFHCSECDGTESSMGSSSLAPIDAEILQVWLQDPDSYLLSQDEDLILAGADLGCLIGALKGAEGSEKAHVLGAGIAVKAYDDTFETDAERQLCLKWLAQNRPLWDHSYTMDYITDRVNQLLQVKPGQ